MGRPLSAYVRNLPHAHKYCWWFARSLLRFRKPVRFLTHYLRRTSPVERLVTLRDGTPVHLSGFPHDVITLFVIFVREDYGRIAPGTVVVDIGANIGAFALFAARSGAAKVLAYEPNELSYRCLVRNAGTAGPVQAIQPRRFAVSSEAGRQVRFPVQPSVYNRIAAADEQGEFETVATTSLSEILAQEAPQGIDLLKLDCEGAEYDILGAASLADLRRIREIRMEYHAGRVAELQQRLREAGFRITLWRADTEKVGNLWARRE